jgi:hypothetical protein
MTFWLRSRYANARTAHPYCVHTLNIPLVLPPLHRVSPRPTWKCRNRYRKLTGFKNENGPGEPSAIAAAKHAADNLGVDDPSLDCRGWARLLQHIRTADTPRP